MNKQKWAVAATLLVGVLVAASGFFTPTKTPNGMDLQAFGQVAVLEGGRLKPLDSIARNALLMIRSKQTVPAGGRTMTAAEWLLNVLFKPEIADGLPIFVIDDPDVLGLLGLQQTADRYYDFKAVQSHAAQIQQQAELARPIEAKLRNRFQAAVINLFDRMFLYHRLKHTMEVAGGLGLHTEIASVMAPGADERIGAMAELGFFRALPGAKSSDWRSAGEALQDLRMGKEHPALKTVAAVSTAVHDNDAAGFNAAVQKWAAFSEQTDPEAAAIARHELLFNRAQPFYAGMMLYVGALLLLFVSWLYQPQTLRKLAFVLLLIGTAVHTGGIVSRIWLQGRPPVTNLYSSAVFVGWGAALLGALLERMHKNGFGTLVAAASGFCSLIIAHHLAADGDTMEMMRAVLDSNFWLATHVVTITIGYSGTFVAGAIATGYAIRRHVAKNPDPAVTKSLTSMTYGIVCFSLLFSFVGTVLGGIWADQSWGRFWGWDPKENGALLIVLWNAIILHARWGGYVRERGLMALSIGGTVITALSWFGVNMLGVGLHSYGFTDKAFTSLAGFCALMLAIAGLALAPPRFRFAARRPPLKNHAPMVTS